MRNSLIEKIDLKQSMKFQFFSLVLISLIFANLNPLPKANAAANPLEIISVTEVSDTSVGILFNSRISKSRINHYVITATFDTLATNSSESAILNSSNLVTSTVKKVLKIKSTGLISTKLTNLSPKAPYIFTVSAKLNQGKLITSESINYLPLSNLMDAVTNLPADWGNPKPTQLPTPAPTSTPLAAPAFTLSSSSETRTVNTAGTGFTVSSTGGAIASFAISATPPGISFNTSTGALTGTPNTVAGATAYTVTATNASGSATQIFTLTVTVAAPAFTLSSSSETRTVNTAATGFTINSTGGAIASFAISATPAGMSFSTSTGALTGTPTTVAGATAYTVTATNTTGSATATFTLTVSPGAASAAAITTQPTGAASGSTLATQPVIRIVDASGNTVTSSTVNVVALIASGSGTLSGATVAAVAGIATFTNLVITGTAGNFTLTFTPTLLTPVTSSSLAITAGAASAAAITTQPTGAASGSTLATQPVIRIVDASGNTVTSSTVNVVASIASGSGTLSGATAAAVAGIATFTNLVITGTAGNFTLAFTPTSLTPVTSSSLAITAVVYTVGQRGPGGGIVYYVSATVFSSPGSTCNTNGVSGSSTCQYLEVAPATWQSNGASVANDLYAKWTTNTTVVTGQNTTTASTEGIYAMRERETFNWKIGQGFYNTSVMKVSGATSAAQAAVLAYAGGSVAGQWFIPSMNELNELCKYARGQTTGVLTVACTTGGTLKSTSYAGSDLGGFVNNYYWSSSEANVNSAYLQNFTNGDQINYGKEGSPAVRPVRAF